MILDPDAYDPEPAPVTVRQVRGHAILPDGTRIDDALTVVTLTRVYVFTRALPSGLTTRFVADHDLTDDTLDAVRRDRLTSAIPVTVDLPAGEGTVEMWKAGGCACGNRAPTGPPWPVDRSGT